jgi:hypothetical protein
MFWRSSERAIRGRSALGIAREKGYRSIAFPLIGAGTGGFQPEQALAIMQDEARQNEYGGEVRIVRFKRAGCAVALIRGWASAALEPGPTGARSNRRVPLVGAAFVVSVFWVINFACTCGAAV